MKNDSFVIPEWAVEPLEYGDFSDLSSKEESALVSFIEKNELKNACFSFEGESYFSEFNDVTDDVSGSVVDVDVCIL